MLVREAIEEGMVRPEPMEFRPARPPLRRLWPLAILSPLFLLTAPAILTNRMLFVPASGAKPIVMHSNMVSADGRRWDMLIESYWQPPGKGRRRERG